MRGANFLRSIIACLVAATFPQSLPAQEPEPDLSRAKAAIQRLKQLPAVLAHVENAEKTANLIRPSIYRKSGECQGFQWVLDFGRYPLQIVAENQLRFVKFSDLNDRLSQSIRVLRLRSEDFEYSYKPVKNWLLKTLPAFADRFDADSEKMLHATTRENMERLIGETVGDIKRAEGELQDGFQGLTRFSRAMSQALDGPTGTVSQFQLAFSEPPSVKGAVSRMELTFSVQERELKYETETGMKYPGGSFYSSVVTPFGYGRPWPKCAQTWALVHFSEFRDQYRGEFNKVVAEVNRVAGAVSVGSDSSLSDILTRIVEIQRRYEAVVERLRKSQISPGGALQELHINTARRAVRNLANYARTELQ